MNDIAMPPTPEGSRYEHPFGVLTNIPLVWLALAALLAPHSRLAEARSTLRWFVAAVTLLFGMCALTLCLHNSMSLRYELEYASPLVLLAVVGILSLERALAGRPVWRHAARWGWGLLLVFSVAFNLLARFQLYSGIQVDLGLFVSQAGRVDEAITHFQKALKSQPNNVQAHNSLGVALLQKGRLDEATLHFQKALATQPGSAVVCYNLGNALLEQGRVEEAILRFREALRVQPNYAEAHNNLGTALVRLGRLSEAIGHYEQGLRLKPEDATARNNLGVARYQLGEIFAAQDKWEEAIRQYQRAIELKPDQAQAHDSLGLALSRQGRFAEAVVHYGKALEMEPGLLTTQNNLAWVLATCGEASVRAGARAVELAEQANQLVKGQDAGILDTLAAAYAEAGRFDDAVRTAQTAIVLARGAGSAETAWRIQARWQLYQAGRPYRERSPTAP